MKKLTTIVLLMFGAANAHAFGMNGCYMVVKGASSTILCLDHVGEESLDGSGVLLGVFQPFSGDMPSQCWNTKTIVRGATDYAFARTGEIIRFRFKNTDFAEAKVQLLNPDGSVSEGQATRFPDQQLLENKLANLTYENCK